MNRGAPSPSERRSGEEQEKSLYLLNDDINTFEHVISSLVEICDHDELQAEQCAFIAHHKGGCIVKIGDSATIEEMSYRLKEANLETVII